MLRSMFSAVSGLRNHQIFMDVVGNNIANINTVGYKASRVTFQDILSQNIRGATAAGEGRGGTNPLQVGLGMVLASTDIQLVQGNLQSTGKNTDVAIQGDGLFILSDGQQVAYSRAGAFDVDSNGRLVNSSNGLQVQGWQATDEGVVDSTQPLGSIRIPLGQTSVAQATGQVRMSGNLNSAAEVGANVQSAVGVYDAQGNRHILTFTFTKSATANEWTWAVTADPGDASVTGLTPSPAAGTAFAFTPEGYFDQDNNAAWWDSSDNTPVATVTVEFNNGAPDLVSKIDLSKLTQLAQSGELGESNGDVTPVQDGLPLGTLSTFSIGPKGDIVGQYSNGLNRAIGQIGLATFANTAGLIRVGSNMFSSSASSGEAQIGAPGTGGRGSLSAGFLEQSNVDLAQQFTDLILAGRGFQANSRVITATDEMLQDLVNLKR